jgi:hypothetical protein
VSDCPALYTNALLELFCCCCVFLLLACLLIFALYFSSNRGFLLIQAHISRAKLPISDYINDTRTVLDQIPRLLAAMQYVSLDDSAASGSFDLMCMYSKVRQILATRSNVSILFQMHFIIRSCTVMIGWLLFVADCC